MLTDADVARQDREDMAEDAQWCEARLRDLGGSVREALSPEEQAGRGAYCMALDRRPAGLRASMEDPD